MQMELALPSIIDMHEDAIGNDIALLLSEGPNSMQSWVPRMELCEKGDQGQRLVRDALKWSHGLDPQMMTCCVSTKGAQCLVVDQETAPALKKPHITGDPDAAKKFLGVHRTFWACPEGFTPLLEALPFGVEDTCCSFFDPSKGAANAQPQTCGAVHCSKDPSGIEVAYCDRKATSQTQYSEDMHSAYLSGPTTKEGTDPRTSCIVNQITLKTGETKDATEVEDKSEQLGACQKRSEDLAKEGLARRCSLCEREVQKEPGGKKSPAYKCTECGRVDRAMHSGWECAALPPDFSCGSKESSVKVRTYQNKLDFAIHRTLRTALSPAEHIDDYNDGVYRQGGLPSMSSPLRWRAKGAVPLFGHRESDSLRSQKGSFQLRGEAHGMCSSDGEMVSKLRLERDRDEPLQASADDFTADDERMKQVLDGLGAQMGLADVRSVLFPRISAEADFSDPGDVPFSDATSHYFACSDSRATYGILGTPGGDLAEFLLAMNVMERARAPNTDPLGDGTIFYHFQEYLQDMVASGKKHFFYCVGSDALQRWAKMAQVADPLHPRGNGEITRLVEYGVFPDHIGSAHLRQMLQDPAGYRCRRGLVLSVIRAFLTVYYDVSHPSRGRLIMAAHDGDYSAEAVLYVDRSSGYPCGNMAPMVVPVVAGRPELFVVHRAAVDIFRERLARFVVSRLQIPLQNEANIFQSMRDVGSLQLAATLKALLPGVPDYIAQFNG